MPRRTQSTRKNPLIATVTLAALIAGVGLLTGAWFAQPQAIAADDANEWEELVKIEGTAGRSNTMVTKTFELITNREVKIKWDLRPTGSAPLFRATLGTYQENVEKYVNSGVIVRAGGASAKEQKGKLPPGKHRIVFAMKRMRYSFSIHAKR